MDKNSIKELPCPSGGQGSMLLRQGATIWSLVEELNIPHATGMAKKKKKKKKERKKKKKLKKEIH